MIRIRRRALGMTRTGRRAFLEATKSGRALLAPLAPLAALASSRTLGTGPRALVPTVLMAVLPLLMTSCDSGRTPTGMGPMGNSLQLVSVEPAFGASLLVGTRVDFRLRYNCAADTCFALVLLLEETGLPISSSFSGNLALSRGEGSIDLGVSATRPGTTLEVLLILHDSIFFIPLIDTPLFEARLDGGFVWQ